MSDPNAQVAEPFRNILNTFAALVRGEKQDTKTTGTKEGNERTA